MIDNTLLLTGVAGGQEIFLPTLFLQAQDGGGMNLSFFIMMGGMFIVMYFFMIRPQQKKAKDQKEFMTQLKKGDKIVTIGGVHGRVLKVEDDTLLIEVDTNTKLKIERSAVSLDSTRRINEDAGKPAELVKKDGVTALKD